MTPAEREAIRARRDAIYATSTYPALLAATDRAFADVPALLAALSTVEADLETALAERDEARQGIEELKAEKAWLHRELDAALVAGSRLRAEVKAMRPVVEAAGAWRVERLDTAARVRLNHALKDAVDAWRESRPGETPPGAGGDECPCGDPRCSTAARRERAAWAKDIASMLRGMTASPDAAGYRAAADWLDPPAVPALRGTDADPTPGPTGNLAPTGSTVVVPDDAQQVIKRELWGRLDEVMRPVGSKHEIDIGPTTLGEWLGDRVYAALMEAGYVD